MVVKMKKSWEAKVYSDEELYALNLYLHTRNEPVTRNSGQFIVITEAGLDEFTALTEIDHQRRLFIGTDSQGIDWMVRQSGSTNFALFCLESWKRFNWGRRN